MPRGDTGEQGNKRGRKDISVLNWNREGLRTGLKNMPENIFDKYDVCTLAETFVYDESTVNIRGFYNIHSLARQGEGGRPVEGLECLMKPHMTPFRVVAKDEDILIVQTDYCFVITVYFSPECTTVDIIDNLAKAFHMVPPKEKK